MRYLVTGGAGFIGSHLVDSLLADGHDVCALDNLSTGSLANLSRAWENEHFTFVHGSVVDPYVVDDAVRGCDLVVHLGAAVGVKLIMEQPLRSFLSNVRGGEVVLEAAHRYGKKVFVASTSEIYGKNGGQAMAETADRLLGPPGVIRWSYSTSKAVDEILANLYNSDKGLPTVVGRFFNTVGPRQSAAYGMVIPRLVRQALSGDEMTVYGDGLQTRCFLHVDDCVRAVRLLLDNEQAVGQTFNVGSEHEVSILTLAQTIQRRLGSTSPIRLVPYDEAFGADSGFEDMQRRVPQITRIVELTGWRPAIGLDRIIDDVAATVASNSNPPARVIV